MAIRFLFLKGNVGPARHGAKVEEATALFQVAACHTTNARAMTCGIMAASAVPRLLEKQ